MASTTLSELTNLNNLNNLNSLNNLNNLTTNLNSTANSLNTNSPNNSNDSSHNLSTGSCNSNASISTLNINILNKVLETQPNSTDSGIGSEKSCTPDNNLNNQKKTQFVKLQFDNNNSKLEQHNKVEKKRKDVINYWIEELSKVVPDVDQTKDTKNQKLRKAFDYIKGLKEKVETLILANTPEKQVKEIKGLYQRINELENQNQQYLNLLKQAGINPGNQSQTELWNSKPTKYSNKLNQNDLVNQTVDIATTTYSTITTNTATNKKKNTKKNSTCNKNNNQQTPNKPNLPAQMIVMNDPNQLQFINQDNNSESLQAQSINLINNQPQLQIRPPTNYQLLPNGQLCSAGDSMTNATSNLMPGQIIISSQPFINQPASAIMLPNGQIIVQNQPNLIFNPNSGLMLTNSSLVNNQNTTSVSNQATTQQPQNGMTQTNSTSNTTLQINPLNSSTTNTKTNFTVNSSACNSSLNTTSAINSFVNSTVITNSNPKTTFTSTTNLPQTGSYLSNNNSSFNLSNTGKQIKTKKAPAKPKKATSSTVKEKPNKANKTKKNTKKDLNKDQQTLNNLSNVNQNLGIDQHIDNNDSSIIGKRDILKEATDTILFDGPGVDLDQHHHQDQSANNNTFNKVNESNDTINDAISSVINSSINEYDGLAQDNTSLVTENSINQSDKVEQPPNKKKRLNYEEKTDYMQEMITNQEMSETELNQSNQENVTEIDKLLNMNNENAVNNEMNFDFSDQTANQLNNELNKSNNQDTFDNEQNNESFLSSLTNSDALNELFNNGQERQKNEDKNNNTVDDLFCNQINHPISHSISSITENDKSKKPVDTSSKDKQNDSLHYLNDPFKSPLNLLSQELDKTNQTPISQPSMSSHLSYSAESLITKQSTHTNSTDFLIDESNLFLKDNLQTTTKSSSSNNQQQVNKSISYSAESLIHSSSLRDDLKKHSNIYNHTQLIHQQPQTNEIISNDIVSNLSQPSPVGSHHSTSSSRPPSNSILSPHPTTSTANSHHLNRSLNSDNSSLNNSMNKELNSNSNQFSFMYNDDRNNTSLFSSSTTNSSLTNQQQQQKHNNNNNNYHTSFNSAGNTSLSNLLNPDSDLLSTSTAVTANNHQTTNSFFNPMQPNSYPLQESNPILSSFNYKDPLNTNQSNYKSSLFTNTSNLFTDPLNTNNNHQIEQSLRKSSSSATSSSGKRSNNLSPNSNNKSVTNKKSSIKLASQLIQNPNAQNNPQLFTDHYTSSAISTQNQSNRQLYFDSNLSTNNSLVNNSLTSNNTAQSRSADFSMSYLQMPDFNSSGNSSNTRTTIDQMNDKNHNNLSTSNTSSSVFNNNQLTNDNYFLRPQTSSTNNQLTLQNASTNRPNFNLSNIIQDIGTPSSNTSNNSLDFPRLSSGSKINHNSFAPNCNNQHTYFNSSPDQVNSSQFSSTSANMHSSFNNILNTDNQHHHLHHLTSLNSNNSRLNNTLNNSSSLHNRQSTSTHQHHDAANLYRSFSNAPQLVPSQFNLTTDHQTNSMNSLSMPTIGATANLSGLNSQTNNSTLISSQNVAQNPYSSYNSVLQFKF